MLKRLALLVLILGLALLPPLPRGHASTILESTDALELVTSTTAGIDYTASFADHTTTTFAPGKSAGAISSATTTTIVSAPADATAPSTVLNLVGATLSQAQVQLVWTAATDNVAVSAYQVYQDLTGACTAFTTAGAPVSATATVANLPANTSVSFVIRAIDSSGNLSAADSNCVTVTTLPLVDTIPPSTMTNLAIAGTYAGSVLLTFSAGTDSPGGTTPKATIEYCVGAGCTSFTSVQTDIATTQLVVSLSPNTVHCFRGFFTDLAGNQSAAYSNVVCGTTAAVGLLQPRRAIPFGVSRLPRN